MLEVEVVVTVSYHLVLSTRSAWQLERSTSPLLCVLELRRLLLSHFPIPRKFTTSQTSSYTQNCSDWLLAAETPLNCCCCLCKRPSNDDIFRVHLPLPQILRYHVVSGTLGDGNQNSMEDAIFSLINNPQRPPSTYVTSTADMKIFSAVMMMMKSVE